MDRNLVDTIVKFIKTLYKPEDIVVSLLHHTDSDGVKKPEYYIYVYFDYINEKYLRNRLANNTVANKEKSIELEIRKYVESYFGIRTSGLSLEGFAPFVYHGLTIDVVSHESEEY